MRIAVIGSGAMGTMFAARLSKAASVSLFGTWKEQLSTIEEYGLVLTDHSGGENKYELAVGDYSSNEGSYHVALILVKGSQTERAAAAAKNILSQDGLALTLQNGLGHVEILEASVGPDRSALGITSEGAMIMGLGRTHHSGAGVTYVGTTPSTEERLSQIAAVFRNSGFETHLSQDLDGLVWGKLVVNAGINPLTALLQVRNGFLTTDKVVQDLMCRAAEETRAVAEAKGIKLPYESASTRIVEVAIATAENRSSMAQDIARGAPTEIDSINGQIVRNADHLNVDVPVNRALLHLIKHQISTGDWRSAISSLSGEIKGHFEYLALIGNS